MTTRFRNQVFSRLGWLCPLSVVLCVVVYAAADARVDQPGDARTGETVGAIDGQFIAITGPMTADMAAGQVRTILRSGSDVRVKSGTARIDLVEGGHISICGPAHFSVLKSAGALTLALDTGSIHAYIEGAPALTVYTPQIKAQTVAIGGSPQDTLVGFDTPGAMCIRAKLGAVRIEQQLTGQSVIIPQGGDVLLTNGQLESLRTSAGHCSCELQLAKNLAPPTAEVSQLATADEVRNKTYEAKPTTRSVYPENSAGAEGPIYKVFIPPLRFDANAKVQPEVDPKMIVLVRRVRVRPTLIFQGRVEGESVASAAPALPPPVTVPPAATSNTASPTPGNSSTQANGSMVERVRNFVRKLWPRSS